MKKKHPNLILKSKIAVAVYDVKVSIYVSHDLVRTFNAARKFYSQERDDEPCKACCITDCLGRFAVMFELQHISVNAVAHEVDHLADDILDYVNYTPCNRCRKENNEPRAYLVGFLNQAITKVLRKAKLL